VAGGGASGDGGGAGKKEEEADHRAGIGLGFSLGGPFIRTQFGKK
jgi:hypothetical protein